MMENHLSCFGTATTQDVKKVKIFCHCRFYRQGEIENGKM